MGVREAPPQVGLGAGFSCQGSG